MSLSASDGEETCSHARMHRVRHSQPGSVKGVCGYETRRRTKDLSAFSVLSVGQCFKDSYPRNMTYVLIKFLLKFLLLENCFPPCLLGLRLSRDRENFSEAADKVKILIFTWLQGLKFICDSSQRDIPKPEPRCSLCQQESSDVF